MPSTIGSWSILKTGGTTRPLRGQLYCGHHQRQCCLGIGDWPPKFIVTIAHLQPISPKNRLMKYADDSYFLIGSRNIQSVHDELGHVLPPGRPRRTST